MHIRRHLTTPCAQTARTLPIQGSSDTSTNKGIIKSEQQILRCKDRTCQVKSSKSRKQSKHRRNFTQAGANQMPSHVLVTATTFQDKTLDRHRRQTIINLFVEHHQGLRSNSGGVPNDRNLRKPVPGSLRTSLQVSLYIYTKKSASILSKLRLTCMLRVRKRITSSSWSSRC